MEDQEFASLKETTHIHGPFSFMGLTVANALHSLFYYFFILGEFLVSLFFVLIGKETIPWRDITYRVKIYGVARIGFTMLFSFFLGLITTALIGLQFIAFGISNYVNQFVTLTLVHNMVPAMLALLLLISHAKHYHADQTSLINYSKEVPNIHAQFAKKAWPELLASLITLTISFFYGIFAALSGEILAGSYVLNQSLTQYRFNIQNYLTFTDIYKGLIITAVLAIMLGILKSHYIFYTKEDDVLEARYTINMVVAGIGLILTIITLSEIFFIRIT
jgi:ABC-type transporter Mla maintaining outer membrane lipid asymmetry permease subunit MlaE